MWAEEATLRQEEEELEAVGKTEAGGKTGACTIKPTYAGN